MIVFLNGQFVPEENARVSVFDRSFLYGDGLFETMRVANGVPFQWREHLTRLERGASLLGICLPFQTEELRRHAGSLIAQNRMSKGVLRLQLSRGSGRRGYSPSGADSPLIVMTFHDSALADQNILRQWNLKTSSVCLPDSDPLASFKTCNKLYQILARAEADRSDTDEALLLNSDGQVLEGAASNLFWIDRGTVCTPPLGSGILVGVTRALILELCRELNVPTDQRMITATQLTRMEGVFLSLSSAGLIEAVSLDGKPLAKSHLTQRLYAAYLGALSRETNS